MSEGKPKVFISYSWEDKAISRKLADCLRRDGAQVWIDYSENKAGDSFIKKMNSGLEWCDTFVLLWSKSAANSNFVSMEWEGALANNLKIIPCLIDKTKLPIILLGRIYKDLSNFDEGYNSLAKDLNLIVQEEKPKEVKKVVETPKREEIKKPELTEKPNEAKKKIHAERVEIKPESEVITTTIKKKWHKPVGIILSVICLAIIMYIFFNIINRKPEKQEATILKQTLKQSLRDKPLSNGLSENDVNTMLKEKNLFDGYRNENGTGFENDFELQKNGQVVCDLNSGLMWQQSGSSTEMTFEEAKRWVTLLKRKSFAGFSDWRLPTLEEAMSLMEPERKKINYINSIFDNIQPWIWTADLVQGESRRAWVVGFSSGYCLMRFFDATTYVLAVRSVQSSKE